MGVVSADQGRVWRESARPAQFRPRPAGFPLGRSLRLLHSTPPMRVEEDAGPPLAPLRRGGPIPHRYPRPGAPAIIPWPSAGIRSGRGAAW